MNSSVKQKLSDDLKLAMKGHDKLRCSVLRLLMSAIQNVEIAKKITLEDDAVLGLIAKDVRQHKESIEAFKQGNRQDLVDREEAEMVILQEYMPEQINHEEIAVAVRKVIDEVGAQGLQDKGKVMSKLMPLLKGKADGKDINTVVTELLG